MEEQQIEKKIILKNINSGKMTSKGKNYEPMNDLAIKSLAESIDKLLGQNGIICEIEFEGITLSDVQE